MTSSLQEFIPPGWTLVKPYFSGGKWWASLEKDGERVTASGSTMDTAIAMAVCEVKAKGTK